MNLLKQMREAVNGGRQRAGAVSCFPWSSRCAQLDFWCLQKSSLTCSHPSVKLQELTAGPRLLPFHQGSMGIQFTQQRT